MITPALRKEIEAISHAQATEVYRTLGTKYGEAETPRHLHDGFDAQTIPYSSVRPFYEFIQWTIPGTSAATAANYGVFWIAPAQCVVTAFWEVHQTLGTNGGAVTVTLEKLATGVAPDSGVVMLNTALSLKTTINTVQEGTIVNTGTSGMPDAGLRAGERLCLKDAGTLTAVANVTVLVTIKYQ